jgi:hypothetical protein
VKKATRMLAAIVVLAVGTASAADLAAAKDNLNTF